MPVLAHLLHGNGGLAKGRYRARQGRFRTQMGQVRLGGERVAKAAKTAPCRWPALANRSAAGDPPPGLRLASGPSPRVGRRVGLG